MYIGIGRLGHLAIHCLSKMGHEVTSVTNSMDKEPFIIIKKLAANMINTIDVKESVKKLEESFNFIIKAIPSTRNGFDA